MRYVIHFSLSLLLAARVSAMTIAVDPFVALTNFTALGEWNTNGNFESWTTASVSGAIVTNGALNGTGSAATAQISRLNLASGPDLELGFNDFLDLRIQVPAAFAGDLRVYYGTTNTTGIGAARMLTISNSIVVQDGTRHVYRFDLGLERLWRANLSDLRVELTSALGAAFAIDYLRVGDLAGDIYLPRYTTANPAAGQTNELGRPVMDMVSKHFRFQWDTNVITSSFWTANMPHGTLRNLEECWQLYAKRLGYSEPSQSWTPANRDGNKYKVNVSAWFSGYWAGGDTGDYGRLNITPDGLQVDPPTWVIPHELMHVFQFHQHDGGQTVDGSWSEGHANYGRELWLTYYTNLYSNSSGIDANYINSAHLTVAHGRDYYLSWPFFLYLDENPDGLPDLGFGTMAKIWQTNAAGIYPYTTLENITPTSSVKDIIGWFARRELTFNYQNQIAITNALNAQNPTVWRRFLTSELVRRPDDTNWWRVPMESAPMQGAYAIHELVPPAGNSNRTVTVNFHGLPDAARGADWRTAFIVISDAGVERYSPLWNSGSNSITLVPGENRLYLSVAGTPDTVLFTGFDDLVYPYRSHGSKQRLHYELQVFGAPPRESNHGGTSGLTQHANGGGWKASTAIVDATAYLGPNARVLDSARIRGTARVEDFAVVRGNAIVTNSAVVSGHALVWENSFVRDNAKVRDWAVVSGSAVVSGNGRALEHAQIQGGVLTDFATAKGSAIMWDNGTADVVGGYGVVEGDYMIGRTVTNGFAFGHLPYVGVPDNWIRTAPNRQFAQYEFDATNDSMIRDQIGVTDGYPQGSPTWYATDGKRAGFLAFNGVNQYVTLDRSLSDLKEITVTAWVKWSGGNSNQPVWYFGSATNKGMTLTPDDGAGHAKFAIVNGGAVQTLAWTNALPIGVWTHVAVSLSNSVTGRLYINGTNVATASVTIAPDQLNAANTSTGGQHNYFARGIGSSLPFFQGALDSVRIFTGALTDAEIFNLYAPSPNAGTVYVDLRATQASAGGATWTNLGTLGNFTRIGTPSLSANVAGTGIPGVLFNGASGAYGGPNSVSDLDSGSDRSLEVWAYNSALVAEETMVSWAHRGFTRQNMGFNFGNHATWGAATHWGDDVSWGGTPPTANAWHHLVYTYSNTVVKVYVDGAVRTTQTLGGVLDTFTNEPINLACQRDTANGTRSLWFSGYLNSVRIHGGVLSEIQIVNNLQSGPWTPPTTPAITFAGISNVTLNAGITLVITNSAADPNQPPLPLTFSIVSAPANTIINPSNGLFTWRPAVAQANTTNTITLRVANNAATSLAATQNFVAKVNPIANPTVCAPAIAGGQFVFQANGPSGPDYTVQVSTNLSIWTALLITNPPTVPWSFVDVYATNFPQRFYRLQLGP